MLPKITLDLKVGPFLGSRQEVIRIWIRMLGMGTEGEVWIKFLD